MKINKQKRLIQVLAALALVFALATPQAAEQRQRGEGQGADRGNREGWQKTKRVLRDLAIEPGQTVADIGCGTGYFTFLLADIVGDTGLVFGTEINEKSLDQVNKRAKKEEIKNVKTILSDPDATKLDAACLDAAIIVNVLHHVEKETRPTLVADIARATKPDGFLFVLDWRVDMAGDRDLAQRIPKKELIDLIEKAGYELDAEFHYLTNQVFFRFKKTDAKEQKDPAPDTK